jgi:hypothetical protein
MCRIPLVNADYEYPNPPIRSELYRNNISLDDGPACRNWIGWVGDGILSRKEKRGQVRDSTGTLFWVNIRWFLTED